MDINEVQETLAHANTYLTNLNTLKTEIKRAETQILQTFEVTQNNIHETFKNIKKFVLNLLETRENALLKYAEKIKIDSTKPLALCDKLICEKIEHTKKLIQIGQSFPVVDINNSQNGSIKTFVKHASFIGTLPEVPQLKEVPYITFICDQSNFEDDFSNICNSFGEIYKIAPIQLTKFEEKPGAISLEWNCVDNEEKLRDIQEFKLQKLYGNILDSPDIESKFQDCYQGLDSQCLIRNLKLNEKYSFRVCCKFEGASDWCPWSLPLVCSTHLKHFSWSNDNGTYQLTYDNKIATRLKHNIETPEVLLSDGPQFFCGHSVEFTILEKCHKSEAIIGLVCRTVDLSKQSLKAIDGNCFLLDSTGSIFIDGSEKSTKLPGFYQGQKICFTSELHNKTKMRINVDSNDKRVTYDWAIDVDSQVFFACQLGSDQWKILVE